MGPYRSRVGLIWSGVAVILEGLPQMTASEMVYQRVHVLTLVDHLGSTGGAERLALDIAVRLDPSRFASSLCASRFAEDGTPNPSEAHALEMMRESGVRFLPLRRRRRTQAWLWRHLVGYLRRERVQVLHAHMFGSNLWGTVLGRASGVPVVVTHEHTWSFQGEPLRRLLDREVIARFSDAFVAVSREDRRKMIEVEHIPPAAIRFVPNGIAPPPPPTPGRDVRAELGIAADAPVIGSVGALRPQKAYDLLVRAALSLRRAHPSLRVLIVGEGPQQRHLQALLVELGMVDTVLLLGRRLDVPDLLRAMDVAVCSSEFEGSPLAVMEYMAAARPIVSTRVGGIPDLIDDGVHGLLVAPGDAQALAGAIDALLRDPARGRALGERARERRRAEFDLDVMVGKVEALYEELLLARGISVPALAEAHA
jgi:glycosyltransferase involved in cell wall biosynthesis